MVTFEMRFDIGDTAYIATAPNVCERVKIRGVYVGVLRDDAPIYDADGNLVLEKLETWYYFEGHPFRARDCQLGVDKTDAMQRATYVRMNKSGYIG